MTGPAPAPHFAFERYDDPWRWASYWHQIRAALSVNPARVLEIGAGSGAFRAYLREQGVDVVSADIDPARRPDVVVDVARLDHDLPPGVTYDLVSACQVLEHLPFAALEGCLAAIARRARPHALITLPVRGWRVNVQFGVGRRRLALGAHLPTPWPHGLAEGHHWELGVRHSPRRVTRLMERHFTVLRQYRVPENPYHHLWLLAAT